MLEKLKEMMGESEMKSEQPGEGEGEKPGEKPGDKPGQGGPGGTTDEASDKLTNGGGDQGSRTLEKKQGVSSSELPDEFRKLIDAYNTAKKTK